MAEGAERPLVAIAKTARVALAGAVGFGLAAGLLVIVQAMLLARIIDRAIFHGAALSALGPAIAALVGLFFVRAVLSWAGDVIGFEAAGRVKSSLRQRLAAHLLALGPSNAAEAQSGDLATTLVDGVEALEPYIARYLPQMALLGMVPLAIFAAVIPLDWQSGLVLLISGPLIPFFMVLVGARARAVNQRQWRQLLIMGGHFLDAVQGLTTLKLFGAARAEIDLVGRMADSYRRATMEGLRIAFLTSAVLEFFASLAIALVAVLLGARLIRGEGDFYAALLVLLLVPEFFLPLRSFAAHYHARMSALAAAERIFAVLDQPLPVATGRRLPPAPPFALSCHDLSLAYASRPPVLHNLTCEIGAGQMTALVGPSGAGKSTFAAALLGFLAPLAGEVRVNGMPLGEIDRNAWWQTLAYVPQRPRLFAGSIAANLRLARPEATMAALERAAAQAGALAFIEALPRGFETEIGEGGAGLSGGQSQRLALARAFLKDAPLLILDEASAHLDLETEADLVAAIAALTAGRTAIVIAHRLATIARADHILVLEAGRLAEAGTHAALLAKNGVYAGMMAARLGVACVT